MPKVEVCEQGRGLKSVKLGTATIALGCLGSCADTVTPYTLCGSPGACLWIGQGSHVFDHQSIWTMTHQLGFARVARPHFGKL